FTAKQRAQQVNQSLKLLADFAQEGNVEVVERNQLPTIFVGDQYLLTVTESDIAPNQTPEDQAQVWANQLDLLLDRARLERAPDYLRSVGWVSLLVLAAALLLHFFSDISGILHCLNC
ncbi:MAG: hypothetical protein AAFY72_08580, partial [Cyanobacteria bacterium J06649_4]